MNLRHYMLIFGFGTVVAFAAWIVVILNIDPVETGIAGLAIFLLTLFMALSGFFTTMGTFLRSVRFKNRDTEEIVQTSMRQSVMLGLLVIVSLLLLRAEMLSIWTLVVLIAVLGALEYLSLRIKGQKHAHR